VLLDLWELKLQPIQAIITETTAIIIIKEAMPIAARDIMMMTIAIHAMIVTVIMIVETIDTLLKALGKLEPAVETLEKHVVLQQVEPQQTLVVNATEEEFTTRVSLAEEFEEVADHTALTFVKYQFELLADLTSQQKVKLMQKALKTL